MTPLRHDDQLIQVIALPPQFADEVIHAVDDRHILVHGRVPHILAERLMCLLRLKRDVFLLPPRYADADKFFFLHTLLLHEKGCGLSPHAAFGEWCEVFRFVVLQVQYIPPIPVDIAARMV